MNSIGKAALSSQVSGSGNKYAVNASSKSGIKWTDFNYPPLIKIIHYDRSELQDPHKKIATLLWLGHILILIISIINFINNCVQGVGFRIGLSVAFFILFNPFEGICFYQGLLAFLDNDSKFKIYKILSVLLGLFYIAFMIGDFGNFNGFVRIKDVDAFPKALCVIESIFFFVVIIIHFYCTYKAHKWEDGPAKLLTQSESASVASKDRSQSQISQP
ncbi:hypothetical protein ABPG72_015150 [Tetrahymena utriculariae]